MIRRLLWWIAPAWATAASTYVLFAPSVASITTSVTLTRGGDELRTNAVSESSSLLASQGASVLVPVLLPVLLTALPLFTKRRKLRCALGVSAAVVLVPFCLLGMMSIGLWYIPCIPALLGATILELSALSSGAAA